MRLTKICGALVAALFATCALAQDYPTRPVTLVVPYPAGSTADQNGRTVAKVLSGKLSRPVIVENKPGAAAILGAEYVLGQKPDGYTLLYHANGPVGAYAYRFKKLSFDPFTAFTPIHGIGFSPIIAVVRADAPYKTLKEMVEYATQNPEGINYYSIGPGSQNHLVSELLQQIGGFKMTPVPYKGSAPALTDLLAGVIQVVWEFPPVLKPHIEAGKLRAIGITSEQRMPPLLDVPTFAEQGYPEVVFTSWGMISVRATTPKPIVDKLAKAISETLDDPSIINYSQESGSGVMQGYSGEKLRKFIDAENAKYKDLVTRAGVQPE